MLRGCRRRKALLFFLMLLRQVYSGCGPGLVRGGGEEEDCTSPPPHNPLSAPGQGFVVMHYAGVVCDCKTCVQLSLCSSGERHVLRNTYAATEDQVSGRVAGRVRNNPRIHTNRRILSQDKGCRKHFRSPVWQTNPGETFRTF